MPKLTEGARASLLTKPNVVAVWTDPRTGKVAVGVTRKVPREHLASQDVVPSEVEGVETDIIPFAKLPTIRILPPTASEASPLVSPRSLISRRRPCPGGYSVGHVKITAGTLGCWVRDGAGQWVLLSNNHVLANSNEAVEGDAITQPGPYDLEGVTTDPGNWIGRLRTFAYINHDDSGPGGCTIPGVGKFAAVKPQGSVEQPVPNVVDAAIADFFGTVHGAVDPEITSIGTPVGMRPPQVGESVIKTGRTTEHTRDDKIEAVDVTTAVGYGSFQAMYAEQGMVISEKGDPFSQPGDSGSAIVGADDHALIGLLFAGGQLEDGRDVTIFNQIQFVQEILGVHL